MQPRIMEYEDIISTYSHDNDDHEDMQQTEVIDTQYSSVNDQRYRDAHDDLQSTTCSQK